jgi:hypothetical protein
VSRPLIDEDKIMRHRENKTQLVESMTTTVQVEGRFAATRHLSLSNFDDSGMAQAEPAARIVATRAPPFGNEAGARRGS